MESNLIVRQGFTGYERDFETDLDFAQSRFYAKNVGRFTTPDEVLLDQLEDEPQSWNLYQYVRNNPLNLIDPTGQAADCPDCPKECPEGTDCAIDTNGATVTGDETDPVKVETTAKKKKNNPFADFFNGFRRVAEPWQPIIEAVTPAAGPGGVAIKVFSWGSRGVKWGLNIFRGGAQVRRALPVLQRLCFVAGTPILTRAGPKPIEEIREGDEVLSYNETTKQNEYKTVVQTMVRFAEEIEWR